MKLLISWPKPNKKMAMFQQWRRPKPGWAGPLLKSELNSYHVGSVQFTLNFFPLSSSLSSTSAKPSLFVGGNSIRFRRHCLLSKSMLFLFRSLENVLIDSYGNVFCRVECLGRRFDVWRRNRSRRWDPWSWKRRRSRGRQSQEPSSI